MLRFAINPINDINIDDLRIVLYNYIISKQLNEKLLIRIDNLEEDKLIEGKDKEILETLSLFSIDYENTIYQSDNLKYHQKLAMQLMNQKKAFACFCSNEKLEELKDEAKKQNKIFEYDGFCESLSDETVLNVNSPFTVRIKKPETKIEFNDLLKGKLSFSPSEIDSFIILNHDKTPTYNYACAVDDMLYDISTVIRKEAYSVNSAKQIHIRNLLNYDKKIDYIHIPNLETKDNYTIKSLIDDGFLPVAIANYLVLLGNKPHDEIFTIEDAIEWFDIKKISQKVLQLDIDKLKYLNKKHLEEMDEMRLSKILGFADVDIGKLAKFFLEDSSTIKEIKEKINLVFSQKLDYQGSQEDFQQIKECLKNAPFLETFEELETYILNETNLKKENILAPLTYLLIGKEKNKNISKIYSLIKNYLGEIIK